MPKPHASEKKKLPALLRGLRWVMGPVLLVAVLGWIAGNGRASATSRAPEAPAASHAEPATDAPQAASALGPAQVQDLSPAARADLLRETERIVAERNRDSQKERAAFAADGWDMVRTDAPDHALVGLDPALLAGREDELRVQIASTVAGPEQAGKLAEIARRAKSEQTRTLAVEALGRIGAPQAQKELFGLLTEGGFDGQDPARRAIAPLLHPKELDEPYAAQLAAQLDSQKLTPVERKQIAFTLALVGLRDGTQLPAPVLEQLSASSRELLASMTALASQSNPLHSR
jgi:hypothetical protein